MVGEKIDSLDIFNVIKYLQSKVNSNADVSDSDYLLKSWQQYLLG